MRPPAWIAQLARDGSVPRSQVTSESAWALGQLTALGLATEEVQGSRRRVVACDLAALTSWVVATFPPPSESPIPGRRAENIARARRSKAGIATHAIQPLLLRWFSPVPGPLTELTHSLGLVGLTTDRVGRLQPSHPWILLTVENWESFVTITYAGSPVTVVAVYIGGNVADVTVRALADIQPAPQQAIHFGDYDWTGLAIYRRIRASISTLQLYVPDDIAALFAQFADTGLLAGQTPLLTRADDAASVREVIDLIARHNAGLEQEIVPAPLLP